MATIDGYLLSPSERLYIHRGIKEDLRCDGRARLAFRHVDIELCPVPQAAGSARVRLGHGTEVLVAIKGDIQESAPSLTFTVETSSASLAVSRETEDRVVQEYNEALAATLSTIFVESGAFDLGQLEIDGGRFGWALFVDVLILQTAGNVLDTVVMAVRAALGQARLPKVSVEGGGESVGLSVSDAPEDLQALKIDSVPCTVTFGIFMDAELSIGSTMGLDDSHYHYVVDPDSAEEASADCLFTIAMDKDFRVVYSKKHSSPLSMASSKHVPISAVEQLSRTTESALTTLLSAIDKSA